MSSDKALYINDPKIREDTELARDLYGFKSLRDTVSFAIHMVIEAKHNEKTPETKVAAIQQDIQAWLGDNLYQQDEGHKAFFDALNGEK